MDFWQCIIRWGFLKFRKNFMTKESFSGPGHFITIHSAFIATSNRKQEASL